MMTTLLFKMITVTVQRKERSYMDYQKESNHRNSNIKKIKKYKKKKKRKSPNPLFSQDHGIKGGSEGWRSE